MEKIKPHTLSGFQELLPEQQVLMEKMKGILRETYEMYGFTPLDTPVIEDAKILLAKGGGETEKQIYRFQKGDSDLALRFDLTVPLAKYVALHYNELSFPSAGIRSARSTGASGPSGAGSGSSTRRTSTSSATASWTFSTRRRFPPSSIRSSPPSASAGSRSG